MIFEKIKKIYCGSVFSFIYTQKGDFYGFGSNEYCQLGVKTELTNVFRPLKIKFLSNKEIKLFSCGSAFSMCYLENKLYSWGLNRHQ